MISFIIILLSVYIYFIISLLINHKVTLLLSNTLVNLNNNKNTLAYHEI